MLSGLISKLFGGSTDYKKLVNEGAVILDVRTPQEFKEGHIKGSKNISVQQLSSNLKKLDKNKTVITCCRSGMRSANAASILKNNGFTAVNGGGWQSLQSKLH